MRARVALVWPLLVGVILPVVLPRPVLAGCGVKPQIVFAPETGTEVPAEPTILVFLHRGPSYQTTELDELTVEDGKGRPVQFVQKQLRSDGPARVISLAITAAAGQLTVRGHAGRESGAATYRIAEAGKRHRDATTEIVNARYIYASGCPSSNGFLLSVAPKAPAYRVELDGKLWIVPDQPSAFGRSAHGTIVTGGVGCLELVIPTDRPLALDITPLFPDGATGDTRSPICVPTGPSASCRPSGHGGQSCTGQGMACGSGWTWEVSGPVTRAR